MSVTVDSGRPSMDVVVSFDTTGSMSQVLDEVKARVMDLVQRLQSDIPGLRVGIIAHGDYCDAEHFYDIQCLDLSESVADVVTFVNGIEGTGGGDVPECYELALRRTRLNMTWKPASRRVLVVIGDAYPHEPDYPMNVENINWREEVAKLAEMNVHIYGVQVGNDEESSYFFNTLANTTEGQHLQLGNMGHICKVIMGICYREQGPEMIENYEAEVRQKEADKLDPDLECVFGTLRQEVSNASDASSSLTGNSNWNMVKRTSLRKDISNCSSVLTQSPKRVGQKRKLSFSDDEEEDDGVVTLVKDNSVSINTIQRKQRLLEDLAMLQKTINNKLNRKKTKKQIGKKRKLSYNDDEEGDDGKDDSLCNGVMKRKHQKKKDLPSLVSRSVGGRISLSKDTSIIGRLPIKIGQKRKLSFTDDEDDDDDNEDDRNIKINDKQTVWKKTKFDINANIIDVDQTKMKISKGKTVLKNKRIVKANDKKYKKFKSRNNVKKNQKSRPLYREHVSQSRFKLNKLRWSPWNLAACPTDFLKKKQKPEGHWKTCIRNLNSSFRSDLFQKLPKKLQSRKILFEMAIKSENHRTKRVVSFHLTRTIRENNPSLFRLPWYRGVFRSMRPMVDQVLENPCKIFIRWASIPPSQFVKCNRLKTDYDYAWNSKVSPGDKRRLMAHKCLKCAI